MITQIDKENFKIVNKEIQEIHDKYCERFRDKENINRFDTIQEWTEKIIGEETILQTMTIQNNSIIIYDMKNNYYETLCPKDSLFAKVFSMVCQLKYNKDDKTIRLFTNKEWFHSKFNGLLIQGWIGFVEVMTNNFEESIDFENEVDEIKQNLLVKRMVNYLLKVGYLNNKQADNYYLETIGFGKKSLRKIKTLINLVFYIKMAERIYDSKDFVYYDAFVKSYESLEDFMKFASSLSEKFENLNWFQEKIIKIRREYFHKIKLNLYLDKLTSVAISNAIKHYWGMNVDKETEKYMNQHNISE